MCDDLSKKYLLFDEMTCNSVLYPAKIFHYTHASSFHIIPSYEKINSRSIAPKMDWQAENSTPPTFLARMSFITIYAKSLPHLHFLEGSAGNILECRSRMLQISDGYRQPRTADIQLPRIYISHVYSWDKISSATTQKQRR